MKKPSPQLAIVALRLVLGIVVLTQSLVFLHRDDAAGFLTANYRH